MSSDFRAPWFTLKAIADALGIKRGVTAITIKASMKDVTTITVTSLMKVQDMEGLCEVLKTYRLEPIEPEGGTEATSHG